MKKLFNVLNVLIWFKIIPNFSEQTWPFSAFVVSNNSCIYSLSLCVKVLQSLIQLLGAQPIFPYMNGSLHEPNVVFHTGEDRVLFLLGVTTLKMKVFNVLFLRLRNFNLKSFLLIFYVNVYKCFMRLIQTFCYFNWYFKKKFLTSW